MIYLLHSHLNSFNLSRRESHEDPPARPLGITWDRTPIQHGSANVLCLTQCKCVRFATHTLRSTIKSHFGLDVKRHIHRPHNFVLSSPDTQDMPNDIPSGDTCVNRITRLRQKQLSKQHELATSDTRDASVTYIVVLWLD